MPARYLNTSLLYDDCTMLIRSVLLAASPRTAPALSTFSIAQTESPINDASERPIAMSGKPFWKSGGYAVHPSLSQVLTEGAASESPTVTMAYSLEFLAHSTGEKRLPLQEVIVSSTYARGDT